MKMTTAARLLACVLLACWLMDSGQVWAKPTQRRTVSRAPLVPDPDPDEVQPCDPGGSVCASPLPPSIFDPPAMMARPGYVPSYAPTLQRVMPVWPQVWPVQPPQPAWQAEPVLYVQRPQRAYQAPYRATQQYTQPVTYGGAAVCYPSNGFTSGG